VAANAIAKWDGSSWSALGSGMTFEYPQVVALTTFDDGSGAELVAGGFFDIVGGIPAKSIAKWDGAKWSTLGSGVDGAVYALAAFNDGSGRALYAGGAFSSAGGVPAEDVAKWDGTSWSAVGGGMGGLYSPVNALEVFDNGSGPALYAGGEFTTAGGVAASCIATWNGTSWSALGSGLTVVAGAGWLPIANALTVFDDGNGPALIAAGAFSSAGGLTESHIAKWGGCSMPPAAWTDLGSGLAGVSGLPQLTGLGTLEAGSSGALGLADAAPSSAAMLFLSTTSTPAPFKGGTLVSVPVLFSLPLASDALGGSLLPWTAWPAGLSGSSLYFQCAIKDSAAVKGVALSNALGADVP
jgi:hypothetical protein